MGQGGKVEYSIFCSGCPERFLFLQIDIFATRTDVRRFQCILLLFLHATSFACVCVILHNRCWPIRIGGNSSPVSLI